MAFALLGMAIVLAFLLYLFREGYDTDSVPSSLLSSLGPRLPVQVVARQGKLSRAHQMLASDTKQLILVSSSSKGPGFEIADEPDERAQLPPPNAFAPAPPTHITRDGLRLRAIPVALVPYTAAIDR